MNDVECLQCGLATSGDWFCSDACLDEAEREPRLPRGNDLDLATRGYMEQQTRKEGRWP